MNQSPSIANPQESQNGLVPVTPMRLIEMAASQNASIEQLQQLFELKLRVEADEAKKAFHDAFTAFKGETIRIVRDKENTQYSKPGRPAMYTSLENMVATVTPYLSRHDLSSHWEIAQAAGVTVTCVLTHVLGHSVSVTMSGPLDESGAKNKLQQIKSTVTYLKVSTFESVCGLASAFGSMNDDGNGARQPKSTEMPEPELVAALDAIGAACDEDELRRFFNAAYMKAKNLKDSTAMGDLIKARDDRKAQL